MINEDYLEKAKRITWLSVFGALTKMQGYTLSDLIDSKEAKKDILKLTDEITTRLLKKYPPDGPPQPKPKEETDPVAALESNKHPRQDPF